MSDPHAPWFYDLPSDACSEARTWCSELPATTTWQEAWDLCPRGDWLLWLLAKLNSDHKTITLCAVDCARLSLANYETWAPGDLRPRQAIEAAEAWANGTGTEEAARSAAWSAWSAARSAESAAWSAWSAARSAAESAAEAAARSARSAAESAAWSAWSAARSAESAAWSAAESAARSAAHLACADAVRARFPNPPTL